MPVAVKAVRDVAAAGWFLVLLVVLALGALIMLGLAVHGLSALIGTPLPTVHDDPHRVEWGGLALDLLYGLLGAAALAGCYLVGWRRLPTNARRHVGRGLTTLTLSALAVAASVVAVENSKVEAGLLALVLGAAAIRVGRGRSSDEEESVLPASFDTPITIVNEKPSTRIENRTPPRQRPFVFPTVTDLSSGAPSRPAPTHGHDNSPPH